MGNLVDLEMILNGEKFSIELPIKAHVNKYVESFIYNKRVREGSCKLDYFENKTINAENNIFIYDRSFLTNKNSKELSSFGKNFDVNKTNTISTSYKEIMITNQISKSMEGRDTPLFWSHKLPEGTTEADIEIVTNSDQEIYGSYKIDLERGYIYTNYENFFDKESGYYRLHYIISSDSNGNTDRSLLNLEPVVKKVTSDDIDLNTGAIKEDTIGYFREENAGGYTFNLLGNGPWYWKPSGTSTINLIKPSGIDSKDNWNLRVTNGSIKIVSNGKFCHYCIPEYDQQPFNPYKPYVYSTYRKMYFVNKNTLCFTRSNVAILPSKLMHLEITVYDENDLIVEVYTTDEDKKGKLIQGKELEYNVTAIESWDNKSGMVAIGEKLESRYTYHATYYYVSNEYEIKEITFNPLQNKEIKDYMWVIYCIPNLAYDEKAIHYLGVDKDGIIRYCSQSFVHPGYPNLQVRNRDGTFNANTIIGKRYESIEESDFISMYSNLKENDHQYLILGQVFVLEKSLAEDSLIFDVREKRNWLKKDSREKVFRANHKIANSKFGYGDQGHEYSKNNVIIIEVPIYVLNEYGGHMSEEELNKMIKEHAPASKKVITLLTYKKPKVTFDNTISKTIKFNISYEGKFLTYRIYRKEKESEDYKEIYKEIYPSTSFSYTDKELEDKTYYYAFSIEENGIEYPKCMFLKIKAEK